MIPGKGDITYIYSATGAKLEKRTHILKDSTSHNEEITKATAYISGFIYQDNQLSLFGHEEGRVRVKTTNNSPLIFTFDYFLKDHLGNIRTVLTEEKKQDNYPAATLEDGATPTEKNYYTINDANIVNKSVASVIANYANNKGIANNNPSSNTAGLSDKVYKLKSAGGGKTGLGITLRVMAGDEINIFGKSYYYQNNANDNTSNNLPALSIITGLLSAPAGAATTAAHGTVAASQISPLAGTDVGTFLNNGNRTPVTSTTPRAYINYIIMDDHFKYVSGGVSSVGDNSVVKDHHTDLQNIPIPKNGYLYIYCSNESPVDVFFDNLQVVHTKGPLLEETHYYPFGLQMKGICSKAAGGVENKFKFNGGTELDGDFDLNLYETPLRPYDAQSGRFTGIDILSEQNFGTSPFHFANNNPILLNDPTGALTGKEFENIVDALMYSSDGGSWTAYGPCGGGGSGSISYAGGSFTVFGSSGEAFGQASAYMSQHNLWGSQSGFANSFGQALNRYNKDNSGRISADMVAGFYSQKYEGTGRYNIGASASEEKSNWFGVSYTSDKIGSINNVSNFGVSASKMFEMMGGWGKDGASEKINYSDQLYVPNTAVGFVEATIALTKSEEATKALSGAKVLRNLKFVGYGLGAVGAIATYEDYHNGYINGLHASVNIGFTALGMLFPGLGTAVSVVWGVFDYYAGNWLFGDGKKE